MLYTLMENKWLKNNRITKPGKNLRYLRWIAGIFVVIIAGLDIYLSINEYTSLHFFIFEDFPRYVTVHGNYTLLTFISEFSFTDNFEIFYPIVLDIVSVIIAVFAGINAFIGRNWIITLISFILAFIAPCVYTFILQSPIFPMYQLVRLGFLIGLTTIVLVIVSRNSLISTNNSK
jgi:hypothetical protein